MRKLYKNILVCATAAVLAAGSATFAACGKSAKPLLPGNDYTSETPAISNGGFAVEYGDYVYFINGATTHEDNNKFGTPVKGALMRIKTKDLKEGKNDAQIVIPSLIVSSDYTAGFFIYNDRVYYATPNNVKSMSGAIETDWLDFKSASLNGSDVQSYFRLSDNATVFRYVQAGEDDTVYLLYNGKKPNDNNGTTGIQSYNTATKTCTTIAEGASAYVFNSVDKTDPYVYYTMPVKNLIDSDSPITLNYNQIYRASADVTEAPYEYTWDQEYLDDHDGVAPYLNLGTIVLDGVGKPNKDESNLTQFTHDYKDEAGKVIAEPASPQGYTYTLQSYANDGIYFTREDVTTTSSQGGGASLYYLAEGDIGAAEWNSISGNENKLDVVAKPTDTDHASTSALFYIDEKDGYKHHYIYVDGANMIRADVSKTDASVDTQEIWYDASGATLVSREDRDGYGYVWFTRTNGSGTSVERAVYNGTAEDYETLGFGNRDNAPYKALKILDLQHKSSWYPYEIIEDTILFADAESIGSSSYDYIGAVSLTDKDGKYLNNKQFEEINDKWNELNDSDSKKGYFAKLNADEKSNLSSALSYYFITGKTDAFYSNIKDAVELGKKDTYLYTEDEQKAFENFTKDKDIDNSLDNKQFLDGDGISYRTRSYFITSLGTVNEADQEAMDEYWKTYLKNYTVIEEEEGLADWEIALCVVLPVLALACAGAITAYVVIRKKQKAAAQEKPERMRVDTTDDKDVDVYGNGEESDDANGNDEE
ncbi:MAG: hypothetical protein HDP28_03990 [Clostridia bacterium]|nr:hypothetical protein [Clostridia bacterium]